MNHNSKLRMPIAILTTFIGVGFLLFLMLTWSSYDKVQASSPKLNSSNTCFRIVLGGSNIGCSAKNLAGHRELNWLRSTLHYDISNPTHHRGGDYR